MYNYNFNGVNIQSCVDIKDLGVYFSSNGSFTNHISAIVSEALKILGFVSRNSTVFGSADTFRLLYLTLVRPKLEYASIIWTPHTAVASKQLESVQHKFLRIFRFRSNRQMHAFDHDYTRALACAGIQTLATRRSVNDFIFLYSIMRRTILCDDLYTKFRPPEQFYSLRYPSIFVCECYRTSFSLSNPVQHIIRSANTLLRDANVFELSLYMFKKLIFAIF